MVPSKRSWMDAAPRTAAACLALAAGWCAPHAGAQLRFSQPVDVLPGAQEDLAFTRCEMADVNADGESDLLLSGGHIAVALSRGDGIHAPLQLLHDVSDDFVGDAVFHDLDGDGLLDVLAKAGGDGLAMRPALGAGGSYGPALVSMPYTGVLDWLSFQNVLTDLTGDGHVDLLCVSQHVFVLTPTAPTSLRLYVGDGSGHFAPPVELPHGPVPMRTRGEAGLATADLDGDGDVDLVRRIAEPLGDVSVLWNDGSGVFSEQRWTYGAEILTVFDADGDGHVDLIFEDADGGWFAAGVAGGAFASAQPAYATSELARDALQHADFDQDGIPDLVRPTGLSCEVLLGDGQGGFSPAASVSFEPVNMWTPIPRISVVDVNDDQRPDLVGMALDWLNGVNGFEVAYNLTYPAEAPFEDGGGALPSDEHRMLQVGRGDLLPGSLLSIEGSGVPEGGAVWLVLGTQRHDLPFRGGQIGPAMDVLVGPVGGPADRELVWSDVWPSGIPSGLSLWSQIWSEDAHGVWSASTTVRLTAP